MKLKFEPTLAYQTDAVNAVADLFAGQYLGQTSFEISDTLPGGLALTRYGVRNNLTLTDAQLLANTQAIQERNDIRKVASLRHPPGVFKSIKLTREHFRALHDNVPFNPFIYGFQAPGGRAPALERQPYSDHDDQYLGVPSTTCRTRIPDTIDDAALQQSNVVYRNNDRMGGQPIEFIRSTKPIVIIDEPQGVDTTPKPRWAISQIEPAVTLQVGVGETPPSGPMRIPPTPM